MKFGWKEQRLFQWRDLILAVLPGSGNESIFIFFGLNKESKKNYKFYNFILSDKCQS
jgi:hypothetical protein